MKQEIDDFYVYIFLDTEKIGPYYFDNYSFNYQPFYVGKGHKKRYLKHMIYAFSKECQSYNTYFYRKIRKMTQNQKIPLILKIKENLAQTEAFNLEKDLIKKIGRRDLNLGPLCNLTDGGEGRSGSIISQEIRDKISKSEKGKKVSEITKEKLRKYTGRIMSLENRKKVSLAMKNRIISDNTREKMKRFKKGKKLSEKCKNKISNTLKEKYKDPQFKNRFMDAIKKRPLPSLESIEKRKETMKNKDFSLELQRRAKISQKLKGRKLSENQKIAIGNVHRGKSPSDAVKLKIAASLKKYHESKFLTSAPS